MKQERIDIEQARRAIGLRLVTLSMVPSPWSEALKGILHIKQLPHARVAHVFDRRRRPSRTGAGRIAFPLSPGTTSVRSLGGSISSTWLSGWRRRLA